MIIQQVVKVIWQKGRITVDLCTGWPGPHLIHGSLGPSESVIQTASGLIKPFLHISWQSINILYNRPPFPLKIALPMKDLDPHLIHGCSGQTESSTQKASPSVQLFLQGSLLWQTDRLTDHATWSVTTGRIYIRRTAMLAKNYSKVTMWSLQSVWSSSYCLPAQQSYVGHDIVIV